MAEAILRSLLPPGDEARSAGTAAWPGTARATHAIEALREIGLACADRALSLDQDLIDGADLVLCMESHHREAILLHFDAPPGKILLLSDWSDTLDRLGFAGIDIPDPHGGSLHDYRQVRDQMKEMIRKKIHGN